MSSLGFYLTDNTYIGSSGLSLNLDGIEYGLNNNIRNRNIVMHPAKYAKTNPKTGYLGRSEGCLVIPYEISSLIINKIKNRSCIFVYQDSYSYKKKRR
jgi:hypothetical protein